MNVLKNALKKISYVLFPKRCELCGQIIEIDDSVCEDCKNPPLIKPPLCTHCGAAKDDCICKKHKNEYKKIVAPYYYKDSIVTAIHRFKNSDMTFLAERFSKDICKYIEENCSDITFDFVTFVPLRYLKEKRRGYNQSEILAKRIADYFDLEVVACLKKVRYTGVQHKKSASKRRADIFGAYDVDKKYIGNVEGKTILLIDDVKTTGSTLNECAKMLKIYGADLVCCASVAVTNRRKK